MHIQIMEGNIAKILILQEISKKKYFGKINYSSNDQYTVRKPYNYLPKEKKIENTERTYSSKQMFFNSKIDNNKRRKFKKFGY